MGSRKRAYLQEFDGDLSGGHKSNYTRGNRRDLTAAPPQGDDGGRRRRRSED